MWTDLYTFKIFQTITAAYTKCHSLYMVIVAFGITWRQLEDNRRGNSVHIYKHIKYNRTDGDYPLKIYQLRLIPVTIIAYNKRSLQQLFLYLTISQICRYVHALIFQEVSLWRKCRCDFLYLTASAGSLTSLHVYTKYYTCRSLLSEM